MPESRPFNKSTRSGISRIIISFMQRLANFIAGRGELRRRVDAFAKPCSAQFLYLNTACSSASCTNAIRLARPSLTENDDAYYRFDTFGTGSGSRNNKKG